MLKNSDWVFHLQISVALIDVVDYTSSRFTAKTIRFIFHIISNQINISARFFYIYVSRYRGRFDQIADSCYSCVRPNDRRRHDCFYAACALRVAAGVASAEQRRGSST